MNVGKRGISDVVTTVLIILLVLAAVAIIWGYLRNALVESGEQITSDCLTLDLAPESCSSTANLATVKYGRNSGEANLKNVSLILNVGGNSVVSSATNIPKALESFTQTVAVTAKASTFSVAGTITTESGSELLCPQSKEIVCT